jgi:DnaJ-domain-containing protein 1
MFMFYSQSILGSKYYKGGFDCKMSKREASLILGVSQTATKSKVNEAYRRIMMSNHPDQGGSKYLASKVSEARTFLLNKFK